MRSHEEVFSRLMKREEEYMRKRESLRRKRRKILILSVSGITMAAAIIGLLFGIRNSKGVSKNPGTGITEEAVLRPSAVTPKPSETPEEAVCFWKTETETAYAEIDRNLKSAYAVTNNTDANRSATVTVTCYCLNVESNQINVYTVEKNCTGSPAEIPITFSDSEVITGIRTEHVIRENGSEVYSDRFLIVSEDSMQGGE